MLQAPWLKRNDQEGGHLLETSACGLRTHSATQQASKCIERGASQQLLHITVQRFRDGLVFKAHRLLYHSTRGLRVIKNKKKNEEPTPSDAELPRTCLKQPPSNWHLGLRWFTWCACLCLLQYLTKFAPDKAFQLIAWGKLTFDERACCSTCNSACSTCNTPATATCQLPATVKCHRRSASNVNVSPAWCACL